jgi:hypothetical protein
MPLTRDIVHRLPKVELHVQLDRCLRLAHRALGLERADLDILGLNAAHSAFLPVGERSALVDRIARELGEIVR